MRDATATATVRTRDLLSSLGFAAAILVAATPVAARDGGFCSGFKTIVADARDGFEAVRGAQVGYVPDDGGGDDKTRYAATQALPGATRCGVDRDHADGEDLLSTYVCWFAPRADGPAEVQRLATEIAACIGPEPGDQIAQSATGATADIQRKDFAVSVDADAPGRPVVLEIGQR